jgi:NDP-sugar pyrophosphorylase family protein
VERKEMKIEQAVIFCGGRGERLRPLTDQMPKPLVPVNGRPFLEYLFKTLEDAGIKKILLLVGYKGSQIAIYFGPGYLFEFMIEYSWGTESDLTGTRLMNAYDQLDEHFLLLYGDNYLPEIPLDDMKNKYESRLSSIQTTVFSNSKGTGEYGYKNNVWVENKNAALIYDKSGKHPKLNGVDIGYFIVHKPILDSYFLTSRNFSFEEDILSNMAQMGWLSTYVTDQQYYWITDIDSLKVFEKAAFNNSFKSIEWRK